MSEMEFIDGTHHQSDANAPANTGLFSRMSIKAKLWAGYGFAAVMMIAWSGVNILALNHQPVTPTKQVTAAIRPAPYQRDELKAQLSGSASTLGFYLLTNDEQLKHRLEQQLKENEKAITALAGSNPERVASLQKQTSQLATLFEEITKIAGNPAENFPARDFIENYIQPDSQKIGNLLRELTPRATEEAPDREQLEAIYQLRQSWSDALAALFRFITYRDEPAFSVYKNQQSRFQHNLQQLKQDSDNLTERQQSLIKQIDSLQKNFSANIEDLSKIQLSEKWRTDAYLVKKKVIPLLNQLQEEIDQRQPSTAVTKITAPPSADNTGDSNALFLQLGFTGFILLVMGLVTGFLGRTLSNAVQHAEEIARRISDGKLDNHIIVDSADDIGRLLHSMDKMQKKLHLQLESERQQLRKSLRIKQALDHVGNSIVILGKDHKIQYINQSALEMFAAAENEIGDVVSGFSADNLIGFDIGKFHTHAAEHIQQLSNLTTSFQTELNIGERVFDYTATPILDEHHSRLGTVIEWLDKTDVSRVEQHIFDVVEKAKRGDLSHRLSMTCKHSYYATLEEQLNALLGTNEQIIQDTIRVLGAIANGDLTQTVTAAYQGDYQELKNNLNATVKKLTSTIGHIHETAELTKLNAHEIQQGNMELSVRTEQQSASIEKTAASIEQITGIVRNNLGSTQSLNTLAAQTRDEAQEGGQVVTQTITAMSEISEASKRIADIIHVIDEIAFQTNLLALNASVEAAHAGELGRGFAVVATEVRNLAQRSATAAKEITDLIEDSGKKVEEGARLVNESGKTLSDIIEAISKVSQIISEISMAGEEQASGIEQINKAILEIDQTTQQNTAMVEETASASETLGKQADELTRLVGYFRIPEEHASAEEVIAGESSERRSKNRRWKDSVVLFAEEPEIEAPAQVAVNGEWQEF